MALQSIANRETDTLDIHLDDVRKVQYHFCMVPRCDSCVIVL
jgi:hypothetical protein